MNIDERLEALTQSVELLSPMHQDNEKAHKEDRKLYAEHRKLYAQMFERLTRIAESRDTRISDLEWDSDNN